jgi:hypothetical protein
MRLQSKRVRALERRAERAEAEVRKLRRLLNEAEELLAAESDRADKFREAAFGYAASLYPNAEHRAQVAEADASRLAAVLAAVPDYYPEEM